MYDKEYIAAFNLRQVCGMILHSMEYQQWLDWTLVLDAHSPAIALNGDTESFSEQLQTLRNQAEALHKTASAIASSYESARNAGQKIPDTIWINPNPFDNAH